MFKRMMRPMVSFQTEIHGSEFAGSAVGIAPSIDFEPEMHEPESSSLVLRLQRVKPKTPEMRQHIQTLISDLTAIELASLELLAAIDGERREELENDLEEVRRRGREQQTIIDALEADRQQKEFQFHSARNYAESCRDELTSLQTVRVSRWASKADRQALAKKIAKAKDAVRQANEDMARASNAHNEAANDVGLAQARMGAISDCEIKLRGELSGKPYRDPETALLVVPAV